MTDDNCKMDHQTAKKKSKFKNKRQELSSPINVSTSGIGQSSSKRVKSKKAWRSKKNKDLLSSTQKISKEDIVKVDAHDIDESTASTRKKKSKVSKVDDNVKVVQISTMENCSKGIKRGKSEKALRSIKNEDPLSSNKKISKEDTVKVDVHGIDNSTASKRKKKSKVSDVDDDAKVAQISSLEDCSKGMKKWMNEYSESRQSLRKLQQDIDEFMAEHEALKQKENEEKNAELIKDGFQPVEHHKGRKKTTDSESGTTVGSVSQAAMIHNMTKKKKNEIPLDFYRFQKREARRSEIMTLQSKFEQDKKRIQQLRAARKFRPY